MKKLIMAAACAFGIAVGAVAAETQYKVYDVTLTGYTTKGGGTAATDCSDDGYVWRDKVACSIKGVIAGCGCLAAKGDETCENFQIYFWDAKNKVQLKDAKFDGSFLQRIGKKGEKVEQFVVFTAKGPNDEEYELYLACIGSYKESKVDANYDTVAISGGSFVGKVDAPSLLIKGSCTACSIEPDQVKKTQAASVCEDGVCDAAENSDTTVIYGKYNMKYNGTKSKNAEKSGVTAKVLGLPAYVEL